DVEGSAALARPAAGQVAFPQPHGRQRQRVVELFGLVVGLGRIDNGRELFGRRRQLRRWGGIRELGETIRIPRTIHVLLFALLPAFAVAAPAAAETFPTLTGRVVDAADILDPPTRSAIATMLTTLEEKTTDQFVVATVTSLQGQSIEVYANRLANRWALGQKDRNNGVLLLVAPSERKVRIEVGYGLESTLPNQIAQEIIDQTIVPRFRIGDMAGGVAKGVGDIVAVLTGGIEAGKQRAASPQ